MHFLTRKLTIFLVTALTIVSVFVVPGQFAVAATIPYQAQTSAASVSLQPGETKLIALKFLNIGSSSWAAGASKTAVYVYGDSSVFHHSSWLKADEPAVVTPTTIKPGQVATATFLVTAPKTAGTYTERFLLSQAKNAWIKGSVVSVTFKVAPIAAPAVATPAPSTASTATAAATSTVKDNPDWRAELADRGGIEWQLNPTDHTVVTIAFKNTGTKTWTRDGANYVSLYTGTNKRQSPFHDGSWISTSQSVKLKEASVAPHDIGHFVLELRAPEMPGAYTESFQLAAENTAWIFGGTVSLPIRVVAPADYIAKGIENGMDAGDAGAGAAALASSGMYKTQLLLTSTHDVTLLGNGRQTLTYGFKNSGTAPWGSMSIRLASVTPTGKYSRVMDESWISSVEAAKSVKATQPGEIGFIGFTLKAPPKMGTYTASFKLMADDQPVENGQIDIPITVTADGYIEPDTTPVPSSPVVTPPGMNTAPITGDEASLPAEPIIRVGLFATTDDQMQVRGVNGGFSLQQSGTSVCTFNAGEIVTVSYDRANRVYKALGPRCTSQSSTQYVATTDDGLSPLELTDYSRPVSWLPGANDNKFRGKLELRYTPSSDKVWVINELPIEWYLKGIGETSNSSPQEYQRALLTAARTYAMYHVQHATKHADEFYTVDAKYDQVYRGYGAEARDPNVVTAVDATRGQIVTYNGTLAITPYYSRSDGRTRDWTEVWGGSSKPWLVSVQVPWDNGRTLWGHGVGMSATGALGAANDGWTYDHILTYFYTGTELRRAYK